MTTAVSDAPKVSGLTDTVASERTKYLSLRGTKVNLLLAVLVCAGMAAVVSSTMTVTRDEPLESIPALDVFTAPMLGLDAAAIVLFIGAASFFGAEFTKKQGMVTFSVTPNRHRVLTAKVAVTFFVGTLVGVVCVVLAVLIGRAVGSQTGAAQLALTDPAAARLMITTLFQPVYYAIVVGLFAVALRSSVAAVGLGFVLVLIFPAFAGFLPDAAAQLIAPLFPRAAFDSFAGVAEAGSPESVPAWGGALVMIAWLALSWALAARKLRSHDV